MALWSRHRAQRGNGAESGMALVPRSERALLTLAVHAQQLDLRVARLEQRLDETDRVTSELPGHSDVMDVRMHSARLAAELSLVTVELRAEIDRLTAALARSSEPATAEHARRVRALADTIIDLSGGLDSGEPVDAVEPPADTDKADPPA
jgi:hypothetical protein